LDINDHSMRSKGKKEVKVNMVDVLSIEEWI
jgi:hypothetical protein